MTSHEKAEMLKSSIEQLYSKEGRSISYISRLLEINRKTLSDSIKQWNLPEPAPSHHLTPSNQKFLNKNKNLIKSRLDNDVPMTEIANELKISRHILYKTFIKHDDVLSKAHDDYINRCAANAIEKKNEMKSKSSRDYDFEELPDEEWRSIVGYEDYYVSNCGRIKHYIKTYDAYCLMKINHNSVSNRDYVSIEHNSQKKNLSVARIVAHAFVDGFDETHNTVNHIDGDVTNNSASNLEWVSQSDNNKHSYEKLNRPKVNSRTYKFKKILYKDKYEFKTVAAFARFLKKSETQTRRYLSNPKAHDIKFIN